LFKKAEALERENFKLQSELSALELERKTSEARTKAAQVV
jgi:hypothetical protein